MATLAVALVGADVEAMVTTVDNFRKNVTALALNDAAIASNILETVKAWREM
jgi:nicotinic acid phosphoribosyltransferase